MYFRNVFFSIGQFKTKKCCTSIFSINTSTLVLKWSKNFGSKNFPSVKMVKKSIVLKWAKNFDPKISDQKIPLVLKWVKNLLSMKG